MMTRVESRLLWLVIVLNAITGFGLGFLLGHIRACVP